MIDPAHQELLRPPGIDPVFIQLLLFFFRAMQMSVMNPLVSL